ncbi:hypothetical protein [Halanaerobium hydrogeniformans]|uniref:Uncharacterized protein n=1 Tax=Halanaerobium hydrogeniformans TaxID=656519 RepID=E4RK55_HALHG|nr:hypothetical protein [Halanaerobium hydrogeniformans]ADQ14607.1 hypothetical protein Halsa_1176 [Halanaerobium hydrogeniformans]
MNKKSLFSISVVLILTLLMVFGVFLTTNVLAVEPEYISGNDQALPSDIRALDSYKFDPVDLGITTRSGITIDVYDTTRGQEFDWESNRAIAYVFVKGGPGGNLYDYTPGATSGDGLHAPEAPSGNWHGLSHITFYFSDEELTGELLITKQFELGDVVGDVDFPDSITVEVTGPSYLEGELVTIDIDADGYGDILLENLIPGDYDVEELDFEGSDAWDSDIVGSPATVVAGATAVVEVNITNSYLTGELLITKQFELGDVVGDVDFPDSITVEVTGPSYLEGELVTIDIDADGYGDILLENLIPGDYDVEELDFEGSDAWDSDIVGSPATVVAGATATVEVNITNSYLTGELLITKQFDLGDVVGDVDFPDSITVEVTGESYPNGELVTIDIDADGYGEKLLENLIPGLYYVEELDFDGSEIWDSIIVGSPAEVVAGAAAAVEVNIFNNFIMAAETAWAAHDVGEFRYNPGRGGNWATYVEYAVILEDGGVANIYAGQSEYVGYVVFIEDGNYVDIEVYLEDWAFEPGTINLYVQDYSDQPSGNPAPGRFDFKATESGLEASIRVPLNDYYGIHLNVYQLY